MKTNKKLGIYIDYTKAFLMEFENKKIVSRNIEFEEKGNGVDIPENKQAISGSGNQEQHLQSGYYLEISDIIRNYDQVVLFGPSNFKNELFKLLEFDHDFDNIKIQNVNTDKMTDLQYHSFVTEYYK